MTHTGYAHRVPAMTPHNLIGMRVNAEGVGRAALTGTRLYVWQVADDLRVPGATAASVADALDITPRMVAAAARYAAAHPGDIARDRTDALRAVHRHGPPGAAQ